MTRSIPSLALLLLLPSTFARAQEANYWVHQYGTESTLLAGTVIGGSADLGATFYNPAFLARSPGAGFAVSTKVQQYVRSRLPDAAGTGEALVVQRLGPAPSLVAVGVSPGFMRDRPLVFSSLSRSRIDVRLAARGVTSTDALARLPGDERLAGEGLLEQDVSENWFGASSASALGPRFALGATLYVSTRFYRRRTQLNLAVPGDGEQTASAYAASELDYRSYGLLAILGAGYVLEDWSFGLTLTTPRWNAYSTGTNWGALQHAGLDVDGDGDLDPFAEVLDGRDLTVSYRTPWAFGAGARWAAADSTLHVAVQYFTKVSPYTVLPGPGGTSSAGIRLVSGARPVLNAGLGVEQKLAEKLYLIGSATTDFTSRPEGVRTNASLTGWNLYHLTGGVIVGEKDRANLVVGLGAHWGSGPFLINVDLREANEGNRLLGRPREVEASTWAVSLIVGVSVGTEG